jgi:hypothetical protein
MVKIAELKKDELFTTTSGHLHLLIYTRMTDDSINFTIP